MLISRKSEKKGTMKTTFKIGITKLSLLFQIFKFLWSRIKSVQFLLEQTNLTSKTLDWSRHPWHRSNTSWDCLLIVAMFKLCSCYTMSTNTFWMRIQSYIPRKQYLLELDTNSSTYGWKTLEQFFCDSLYCC